MSFCDICKARKATREEPSPQGLVSLCPDCYSIVKPEILKYKNWLKASLKAQK